MIAITKKPSQAANAHNDEQFLQMIPTIKRFARLAFRDLQPEDREEATSEVMCNALAAFRRLVELGKQDLAFATPLAHYGVAHFRSGRRGGHRMNSRDVFSVVGGRLKGFSLESLQSGYCGSSIWSEILADDSLTPVPDQVAFRLDFPAWLRMQSRRKRELARFLVEGNTPAEAAQRFGVSRSRISQMRSELQSSWQEFQGEGKRWVRDKS